MNNNFGDFFKNIAVELPQEYEELRENIQAPDPFGVALNLDSGVSEKKMFVTVFSAADVDDFRGLLGKYRPSKTNIRMLNDHFSAFFKNWQKDRHGQCPYEPFLWALKCTDNYVGSIQANAVPQPWLVEFVGEQLLALYDPKKPDYLNVLRNVIENWDWYQPLHVVLYVYGHLEELSDPQIEEQIRSKLMYRALFAESAFSCLCEKKYSSENVKALMRFVASDEQTDLNNAKIRITKRMRFKLQRYLEDAPKDIFEMAKAYYTDELYSCCRTMRLIFEGEFYPNGVIDEELRALAEEWRNEDPAKQQNLCHQLGALFEKKASDVLKLAPRMGSAKMLNAVLQLEDNKKIDFGSQHELKEMVAQGNVCPAYREYIEKKYLQYGGITGEQSFLFGCAYCLLGNPELVEPLAEAAYFGQAVSVNSKYIFMSVQTKFSDQFRAACEKIKNNCLSDVEKSIRVITVCARIYDQRTTTYPVVFDEVCKYLMQFVAEGARGAVRCASTVLGLIKRIANAENKLRYYEPLMQIYECKGVEFQQVRKDAAAEIRRLFPIT